MKVELDLSTEQLESLDNNLTELLKSLTKKQQTEILKSYIIDKFDKMEYTYKDHWGYDKKELTTFGQELIAGLQEQITESVTDEIMKDENLLSVIQETKDNVIKNLPEIVEGAISTYLTDNLFNSKSTIQSMIQTELWDIRNRNNGVLR